MQELRSAAANFAEERQRWDAGRRELERERSAEATARQALEQEVNGLWVGDGGGSVTVNMI